MRLRTLSILALLCACALPASAQVIRNPTTLLWTASADQGKTLPDGTAAVSDYSIAITLSGASQPVTTLSAVQQNGGTLPAPDATNTVTLVIPAAFRALGFGQYTGTVAAVGPGGTSAPSAPSNPFSSIPPPAAASGLRAK